MRYLVAAFLDRTQAEEAYARLESSNFSMDNIAILGKGYKTTDEFGHSKLPEKKPGDSSSVWPFG